MEDGHNQSTINCVQLKRFLKDFNYDSFMFYKYFYERSRL